MMKLTTLEFAAETLTGILTLALATLLPIAAATLLGWLP